MYNIIRYLHPHLEVYLSYTFIVYYDNNIRYLYRAVTRGIEGGVYLAGMVLSRPPFTELLLASSSIIPSLPTIKGLTAGTLLSLTRILSNVC